MCRKPSAQASADTSVEIPAAGTRKSAARALFPEPDMRRISGYHLIQNAAGALINVTDGNLGATSDGDNTCLWRQEGSHLVHVDGFVWIEDALCWSPEVLRASSHPVALWIMRQYMGAARPRPACRG